MSSETEPSPESGEHPLPPRVPIFNDETAEETRLSKIIEESTRRGFVAGQKASNITYVLKNRQQKAEPVTEPIAAESISKLPLYNDKFGIMHVLSSRSLKAILALFVIVFGGMGMLWVFTLLYGLVTRLFGAERSVNLLSYALPYLWIPVVVFAFFTAVVWVVEKNTKLYTTADGFLVYEKPTIAPLLIFGSTHRVKISQIGSADAKPEHIVFFVLKTQQLTIDSPSNESKYFKKMRGVKNYELLKTALGQ